MNDRFTVEDAKRVCEEHGLMMSGGVYLSDTRKCGCAVGMAVVNAKGDVETASQALIFQSFNIFSEGGTVYSATNFDIPYARGLDVGFETTRDAHTHSEFALPALWEMYSKGINNLDHEDNSLYVRFCEGVEDGREIAKACHRGEIPSDFAEATVEHPEPVTV